VGQSVTATIDPYPDVTPPAGAFGGEWGDEEPWRTIYGQRHEIGSIVVGAWACQQADASIEGNNGHDVYVDEMNEHGDQVERLNLSIAEARALGAALLASADEFDRWTTR
jgi:hypothetical protein